MAADDTTARPTQTAATPTAAGAPAAPSAARPAAGASAPRRAARASARAPRARTRRAPRARRAAARRPRATPRTRVGTTTAPVAVTPIAQAQQLAERAVLIPLGAALEARDRVAGAFDDLRAVASSRSALDRRLKRYERRGGRARTELERDLRRTRARLERELRLGELRRPQLPVARVAPLTDRVAPVRSRVESVVQNGLDAGRRFVEDAQDRIAKVA